MGTFWLSDGREYDVVDRGYANATSLVMLLSVRRYDGRGRAQEVMVFEWDERTGAIEGTATVSGIGAELVQEARRHVLQAIPTRH
jgi:hypothetical protein